MAGFRTTRPDAAGVPPSPFAIQVRLAELYHERCATAFQGCLDATLAANGAWAAALEPVTPAQSLGDAATYWADFAQRSLLFWDTLRRRGNDWLAHEAAGKPPLLAFAWEIVADARGYERPVNCALARILPPDGVAIDTTKRPYVIIDPRAGHGPGIGGFKPESEVGVALQAGHPVYAVIFFPEPVPGQTLADVAQADQHRGPLVINGAPRSYWAGNDAEDPMRYAGGLLGGSWTALLASDLGGGVFDVAHLVDNFEDLNPANTHFGKAYTLFSKIDTEPARFLDFERWWGGYYLMNREEIRWIVDNLFIGNRLAAGRAEWDEGKAFDLRAIRSPIILFASLGDTITPPQQAFNWVADLYPTTADRKANGQVIVGLMHESVGHLGIFVSGSVARRGHAQIAETWGRLDIALHSIAFAPRADLQGRLVDSSAEGFGVAMDVSCHSFIRMARLAAPLMTGGGTLPTMSYHGAAKVMPNYNLMGPVKAALESAVRYLVGDRDIRVHAVSPGPLKTRAASGLEDFDLLLNEAVARPPIGELVDIDDVGLTAAFLTTPYAARVTGTTLYVDGGLSIMA